MSARIGTAQLSGTTIRGAYVAGPKWCTASSPYRIRVVPSARKPNGGWRAQSTGRPTTQ